jgi:hypothetical protein
MATARESAVLTLAEIRSGRESVEYLFNERHRIYALAERAAADDISLGLLKQALARKQPLKITLDLRRGLILRVAQPSRRDLEDFLRTRVPLDRPSRVVPVDVAKIDPSTFNFVDVYQKWPVFRLCTRIIPSYTKAKEIFDFCAQLSCHLPGPYAVTPCIPFQYAHDGCYARAHHMRRIITTKYRYCCEKVFSFANQGNDKLAVKANKWGGCCVVWWYHVAPLVRVRLRLRLKGYPGLSLTLAMVIDPSMFDKPVLLSTWLSAQEEAACHANATVSMYSIQPGSAYTPTNYAGTTFSTDPNYTLTEQTLVAYSGLVTCP